MLADNYLRGRGVPADTLRAELLYRGASEKGLVEADRSLAILMTGLSGLRQHGTCTDPALKRIRSRTGVPFDYSKAMECYLKAAEAGNPAAIFILAESLDMFPDILHGLGAPTTSPHIFFVSRLPKRNSHGRRAAAILIPSVPEESEILPSHCGK